MAQSFQACDKKKFYFQDIALLIKLHSRKCYSGKLHFENMIIWYFGLGALTGVYNMLLIGETLWLLFYKNNNKLEDDLLSIIFYIASS